MLSYFESTLLDLILILNDQFDVSSALEADLICWLALNWSYINIISLFLFTIFSEILSSFPFKIKTIHFYEILLFFNANAILSENYCKGSYW